MGDEKSLVLLNFGFCFYVNLNLCTLFISAPMCCFFYPSSHLFWVSWICDEGYAWRQCYSCMLNSIAEWVQHTLKTSHNEEANKEPSRTSMMEHFCENSYRPLAVNYSRRKAPSQIFDWVLNRSLQWMHYSRKKFFTDSLNW